MACSSTVTGTFLTTLAFKSVATSSSSGVSSLASTLSTVISCDPTSTGFYSFSNCETLVTTIGGGEITYQVPITSTVTYIQAITSTLWATICSSDGTSAPSSTTPSSAPSVTSSSTFATSTSPSSLSTSSGLSPSPAPTTILLQSTLTTLSGGSTVMTAITSVEAVAVTTSSDPGRNTSTVSGNTSDGNSGSTPDAAIIGAIIGGIAALIVMAFAFTFFIRGKKQADGEPGREDKADVSVATTKLMNKRRDRKDDLDIDAEARPYPQGPPYQQSDGSTEMAPEAPPKDTPTMRVVARFKPLPLSPRSTWHSSRPAAGRPLSLAAGDRSSIATIRAAPPIPQLTVDPPSPQIQRTPLLHLANVSPERNSVLLSPPPLPEKSLFMPRSRRGKAAESRDGSPPSRSQSPRTSIRTSFLGTPMLRMPVPSTATLRPPVAQDGGPVDAGPSSSQGVKAAEAADSQGESSGEAPPAYTE